MTVTSGAPRVASLSQAPPAKIVHFAKTSIELVVVGLKPLAEGSLVPTTTPPAHRRM